MYQEDCYYSTTIIGVKWVLFSESLQLMNGLRCFIIVYKFSPRENEGFGKGEKLIGNSSRLSFSPFGYLF